ncbi:MAG: tRNA uridine-5-carboxymethylaminomethyl(34) synthesis GTPase MnmE [Methylocystaceae bacterium]
MNADTIAAVATAPGMGAISIIKISGPQAINLSEQIFTARRAQIKLSELATHRMVLGEINDQGTIIDEVLVSIMRAPGTYTGEDVVEINCHGGYMADHIILEMLLKKGCRLAEPGEFTRRAFLNGRLSLSQAEAVIDIINARSRQGLQMAVSALSGRAQQQLKVIEDKIIQLSALVEACIDFPEEVGDLDHEQAQELTIASIRSVQELINWAERGRVYREGLKVVISGKPNVGKSSLLNLMLNENRVIVSDIPGTTRDTIEDNIEIKGIPIRLIDTAGIRAAGDQIEEMGIKRSRNAITGADLVIVVLDIGAGLTGEDKDIIMLIKEERKRAIFLVNKLDLPEHKINQEQITELETMGTVITASVKEDQGIEELIDTVYKLGIGTDFTQREPEFLANMRQKDALERTLASLYEINNGIECGISLDCLSIDLMNARDYLSEVTGHSIKEEIIDRIFAEFCIGK